MNIGTQSELLNRLIRQGYVDIVTVEGDDSYDVTIRYGNQELPSMGLIDWIQEQLCAFEYCTITRLSNDDELWSVRIGDATLSIYRETP